MTCCSATASSCSQRQRGRVSRRRAGRSGCTARPTTTGSARSTDTAWRCSGDCFYVGRLKGTDGAIWQLTAIDIASSYAWAELVICKQGNPTARQTSKLAERVAKELQAADWKLQRMLSDNGNEFRGLDFTRTLEQLGARHSRIHAGRPQTNGNIEALHKTILDECWRPAFARYIYPRYTGLKRELDTYLNFYNNDRVHHGRLTQGRIPADIVYGARKMEAR